MTSPENQDCANCIGTLSFPIGNGVASIKVYTKSESDSDGGLRLDSNQILTRIQTRIVTQTIHIRTRITSTGFNWHSIFVQLSSS